MHTTKNVAPSWRSSRPIPLISPPPFGSNRTIIQLICSGISLDPK